MTHPNRRQLIIGAAATLATGAVCAQSSGPLRILVGYSAGGGVDAMARLLATGLGKVLGQQVIVENKAGASGMIAADLVSKAPADGQTVLLGETGLLITRLLRPNAGIDPLRALRPVAGLFVSPLVIVANKDLPITDPTSLVAELKARPGQYSYASSGIGTVQHLGFEMLKGETGAYVVHIPYRGASQIVPDVIGGQVPLGVVSATAGLSQHRAGKLRAVAMMSKARLPGGEDVAPLSDVVTGFSVAPRLGLMAAAGLPDAMASRLAEAAREVLAADETVQSALRQGALVDFLASADFGRAQQQESAAWQRVIRERKISVE
ncbi:MAG: tripartite tricarboxylate transporter substrate binding protein [Burkholderiaceae bacterium]|nr:tripartite tricarboxylate transporter substrate binding protein [Rhodoferax sp.]MCP5284130.1 tripartite tricarboxylate transporter substrate binding protein [Burkholderiaceae bacterium]